MISFATTARGCVPDAAVDVFRPPLVAAVDAEVVGVAPSVGSPVPSSPGAILRLVK